jgi:phosphate/sulfate permease
MEKPYTLWQRISSATPKFFRQVQICALAIGGLGGTLATIQGIPSSLTTSMISAGTAIAAIAQFAVKQLEPDNSQANETK